jgi:hypothetical protein
MAWGRVPVVTGVETSPRLVQGAAAMAIPAMAAAASSGHALMM